MLGSLTPRIWMMWTCCLVAVAGVAAWTCLPLTPAGASPSNQIVVPKHLIRFDDGDSISIAWTKKEEMVRILSIDTPEVRHLDHDIPYAQPFGREAAGFLRGCLAVADEAVLLRSGETDRYGRTLGYLLLDGKNYSVLAIEARLAVGPSERFGDNGLPRAYAACRAAAKRAGPVPFEAPHLYRKRMRAVSAYMKAMGTYPAQREPKPR